MCGIIGLYSSVQSPDESTLRTMTDALAHRGPDDSGVWMDPEAGVGLGHRRLAILDLSPLGRQPMDSVCGRYVIAYNGEVYNHVALRRELPDYPFRSTSDTETILAAVSAWGLEAALKRFVGMFAMALWDRTERKLFLVRDRMGIKPLYYGRLGKGWVFGSELKALRACPGFSSRINRGALSLYFRHNFVPAPLSIYEDAWKLEPGQLAIIDDTGLKLVRWWDTASLWRKGSAEPLEIGDVEATERLEELLSDAVSLRMLSDVPLGAFLSGGIDSSTVVALMQRASDRPVRTYSIGFHEKGYNEAGHAKAVARHLGTDHTELYVTPREMLDVIPAMPRFWDEPFADSSQIPTYILSRMTREHVTVSLSGDGGDELFSGYDRYFWTTGVWNAVHRIPAPVRKALVAAGRAVPNRMFDLLGSKGQKVRWRLDAVGMEDFPSLYRYFTSMFKRNEIVLGLEREPDHFLAELPPTSDYWSWMSLYDLLCYLPDDILTKVDRASMAVSLEARVPLLDHRVVEFAARLPQALKVRGGKGKWLLRQVLYRHVPRELVERPKMGFGVPIEQWLHGELRQWCDDLLNPAEIRRQGYLDAGLVEKMWREYLAGEHNWKSSLWEVLMFQAWLAEWKP
ncbi:asparagine synthase (glutamine-hydrolyzing) [Pseudodesulfovibrio sp. F-1]|uniref:asparagine synthase (glutamine-hydrolyzing) n=1 Tax=Pseudodesulfovibrio alkaliphilus TaxID=2661613 RepID=A0A7K1KPJ3_9BACT|nr:asparagine synthase (glutamine-hydrolyzing) [Pseudodesulfovibrio alkaliphilus]MUM77822.1 asparagine synthase (glutamine-hydrolyzing) [Pseudodesulfovibrio alkaliphilus]